MAALGGVGVGGDGGTGRRASMSLLSALKTGWLSKQGHFIKSWKRRFCVLRPDCLIYYSDEQSIDVKGVVHFDQHCTISKTTAKKKGPALRLDGRGRSLVITTVSARPRARSATAAAHSTPRPPLDAPPRPAPPHVPPPQDDDEAFDGWHVAIAAEIRKHQPLAFEGFHRVGDPGGERVDVLEARVGSEIAPIKAKVTGGLPVLFRAHLVDGLVIDAEGVISGTPATAVRHMNVTTSATNYWGTATVPLALTCVEERPKLESYSANPAIYVLHQPVRACIDRRATRSLLLQAARTLARAHAHAHFHARAHAHSHFHAHPRAGPSERAERVRRRAAQVRTSQEQPAAARGARARRGFRGAPWPAGGIRCGRGRGGGDQDRGVELGRRVQSIHHDTNHPLA